MSFQYPSPFSSLLTEKHCKLPDSENTHFHTLQNTVKIDDNGEERERAMQGENKVKQRIAALLSFPSAQLSFPFVHLTLSQTKPKGAAMLGFKIDGCRQTPQ